MHIVLHEPEIHMNTGNIGRTCVCAGASLHLIHPLGFSLDEREVRRAGLDYWRELRLFQYEDFQDFVCANNSPTIYMLTTKGERPYTEASFGPDDYLMFGKESGGIPEGIRNEYAGTCLRIPMLASSRSLNLANSVAVILYEALRQNNFDSLKTTSDYFTSAAPTVQGPLRPE